MLEVPGDLWNVKFFEDDCIPTFIIPTNGVVKSNGLLVMGAGVAKAASNRWPTLPRDLGELVKTEGNKPFYLPKFGLISFPTKHHWKAASDIELIENSAKEVAILAYRNRLRVMALPRVGCGLGGLSWAVVKPVLDQYLNERFIVVTPPDSRLIKEQFKLV